MRSRMEWSDLRLFLAIAREGTLVAAARTLALTQPTMGRRLRELEEEGLVQREVEAGTPVRVTYSLTAKGKDLDPAIRELRVWARRWRRTG